MDADLIADIATANGVYANAIARAALGEFYQRHSVWLYNRLCRNLAIGRLSPIDDVHDVIQETFYRVFKGAKTFDPRFASDSDSDSDSDRVEALVRGWLGGIANRVISDMIRNSESDMPEMVRIELSHVVLKYNREESKPDSTVVKALRKELKKLSPLQQDIISAAQAYYQPDVSYQRLPNGVTRMLAEKHSTSSDNIRQVRRRTMAVLRTKLESLMDEPNAHRYRGQSRT